MFEENTNALRIIGILTIFYVLARLLSGLYKFYMVYYTETAVDFLSFGKWSIITGCTDGIGKGIAYELAKHGSNIILISRNPEKLKKVANNIETKFNVETKCIAFDFSFPDNLPNEDATSSTYDVISDAIKGLEIGILVNNVGIGAEGEFLDPFKRQGYKDATLWISKLIFCNDLSVVKLTEIVLAQMLERRRGLIVNISSMSGHVPVPYGGLYASSKRFVDTFSKALMLEYRKKGIIIQNIQPGPVKTNMNYNKEEEGTLYTPTIETYVSHLMNTIGKADFTTGYRIHGILKFVVSVLPEWVLSKVFVRSAREAK